MRTASCPSDALSGSFFTALLLTGSVEQAERSVSQAIDSLSCGSSGPALLLATVQASFAVQHEGLAPDAGDIEDALPRLPAELRNVLTLSANLRQSFVLRVLAGFPRALCARLLQWEPAQVDSCVSAAMLQLAGRPAEAATPYPAGFPITNQTHDPGCLQYRK